MSQKELIELSDIIHQAVDKIDELLIPTKKDKIKEKSEINFEDKGGMRHRKTKINEITSENKEIKDDESGRKLRRKHSKPLPDLYPHSHCAQSDDELDKYDVLI